MRIAKFIAQSGQHSRRGAERLIADGCVQVNGVRITTPAITIDPETDKVRVNNALVHRERAARLWLYHKPRGYVKQ